MKKILLGVTGSVAAKLTPKLVNLLEASDYEVRVVATEQSLYFWDSKDVNIPIFRETDEWSGFAYIKDQIIPHIALCDWADVFLIAPLTANTLAKMACGICDNLITSVVRAWPLAKPLIVAPSMNTQMWKNPLTKKHLTNLSEYYQAIIIPPIEKKLACGEEGLGAMAELSDILNILADIIDKK
ncbi:MAG: flavoprotein [Candidatus Moraniibacteriota bacterium]